jgi:glycosyltransferase involved in cell wall biosynthesis
LLEGFASMPDIEVHVISCTQVPMQSPEKLASNIWFHSLDVPKIGWLRTAYQGCIRAVRRKLREIQPDIVHGQGTERDCAISAVFSGYPNVVTIHGNMAELARRFSAPLGSYLWLAARLEDFMLPRTKGVLCNSAYTEQLVQPRTKRTWRVPNAIREEFFSHPSDPRSMSPVPVLLCVGDITPRKQPLQILTMAQRLWSDGHEFELYFIGRAEASAAYPAAFFAQLKLAPHHAYYLGEMTSTELLQRFDSANALVHFPSEEAFGLVVAEALACNLKLFASNVGGIRDIAAGVEGVELFDADDFESLETAIGGWLKSGAPRPEAAARSILDRYRPESIATRHLEIYHEVLSTFS